MYKRLNLLVISCIASSFVYAQWSAKDSINLHRLLNGDTEIKINKQALRKIDFGSFIGDPMSVTDKPALKYDETLPSALPEKKPLNISLMPYTANTKFNYDPVFKRKIKVGPDTWRSQPFLALYKQLIPTNWAQNWMDNKVRKSREEIETAGVKQVLGSERANNMFVPSYTISHINGNAASLGNGKTMATTAAGTSIGGLDLMAPFTKDFWDVAGRKRRARTLEVLNNYGDSTTVLINREIILPRQ